MASRSKRTKAQVPSRLILDAGAVIGLARGHQRVRAFLARAIQAGAEVVVPAVVVAETVRGGPKDATVNRVLAAIDSISAADEPVARTAGRLLGTARSEETIDALVVAAAVHLRGGRILTSDPDDLRPLARGAQGVTIHRV